jgi:hypothetical protein
MYLIPPSRLPRPSFSIPPLHTQVCEVAAAVEAASEHPLARAVLEWAQQYVDTRPFASAAAAASHHRAQQQQQQKDDEGEEEPAQHTTPSSRWRLSGSGGAADVAPGLVQNRGAAVNGTATHTGSSSRVSSPKASAGGAPAAAAAGLTSMVAAALDSVGAAAAGGGGGGGGGGQSRFLEAAVRGGGLKVSDVVVSGVLDLGDLGVGGDKGQGRGGEGKEWRQRRWGSCRVCAPAGGTLYVMLQLCRFRGCSVTHLTSGPNPLSLA